MLLNNLYQHHSSTNRWIYSLLKPLEFKSKKKKITFWCLGYDLVVCEFRWGPSFGQLEMSINMLCVVSLFS